MTKNRPSFVKLEGSRNEVFIESSLRCLWTILDQKYQTEGGPWGFKNSVFEMHDGRSAHGDGDEPDFTCGDVQIQWYKHIGRGMEINRDVGFDCLWSMFDYCLTSLREQKEKRKMIIDDLLSELASEAY